MQPERSVCDILYSDQIAAWILSINQTHLSGSLNTSYGHSPVFDFETLSSQLEILNGVSPRLCQAIHIILHYIPPILFLIGSFGNLLSFSVLCRRSVLYPSSYIYLAVLALVDECVLVVGLLRRWSDRLSGRRLEDKHWTLCKLLNFTGVTASCLSVWIIVAVTVERALVIILPLQSTQASRMKRSKFILICLTLTIVGITSHFFFTVDIVTEYASGPVNISEDAHLAMSFDVESASIGTQDYVQGCDFRAIFVENGIKRVWIWIDATLYSYLPFFLITIFNMVILINLHGAKRRRISTIGNWVQTAHPPQKDRSVFQRGWQTLSNWCRCRSQCEAPRLRVCQFCAQSFPIDRFHDPPELLANRRTLSSGAFPNSHILLNTRLRPDQRDRWPVHAYTPAVNIKFGAYQQNGLAVKTVNVERTTRSVVNSEVRQLTVLLLLISGTFLLTTAPVVIVKLVIGWTEASKIHHLVQLELLDGIAEMLMYTNHAANFYLYLAVGTRFRREIKRLLCSRLCKRKTRRKRKLCHH